MKTILLVEDNAANQLLVEDIFEFDEIPAQLVCVETGEEALQAAAEQNIALILLDVMLPGMTGLQTAQQLKSDLATQHIAIWGLSAQAMTGDEEKAMAAGFDNYRTKPIDTTKLAADLREHLLTHQNDN